MPAAVFNPGTVFIITDFVGGCPLLINSRQSAVHADFDIIKPVPGIFELAHAGSLIPNRLIDTEVVQIIVVKVILKTLNARLVFIFQHFLGIRNFIKIGDQNDVIILTGTPAFFHIVFLHIFNHPGIIFMREIFIADNMDNLIGKLGKTLFIFLIIQRFGLTVKSLGRLHQHKFINYRIQYIQADFQ